MKQQIFFLCLFMAISSWVYGQTCNTFETGNGNWQVTNATFGAGTASPAPGGGNYLEARDGNGVSYLFNDTDFNGDLHGGVDQDMSFDYKIINDGSTTGNNNTNVVNLLFLYQGSISTPTSIAVFELNANIVINQNSPWTNITVPIALANNNQLPSSAEGFWRINGVTSGTAAAANWNSLITNATGIFFYVDVVGSSSPSERIGIDNLCICDVLTSTFHLEGENGGRSKSTFYCGEDVYMDATAAQGYWSHQIKAWRRPITTGGLVIPFEWVGVLDNQWWANLGVVNLSDLAQADGNPFEVGYEYQISLRTNNACGTSETFETFKILDIPHDPAFSFEIGGNTAGGDYSITTVPNANVVPVSHSWNIFHESPNGAWPDYSNPVGGNSNINTESATFDNLLYDVPYYVRHGIWKNGCFTWQQEVLQFQLSPSGRLANGGTEYFVKQKRNANADNLSWSQVKQEVSAITLENTKLSRTAANTVHISPNPSSHSSIVRVEIDGIIKQVELIDMSGKQIRISMNETGSQKSSFAINETISAGIYIVRILTEDNNVLMDKLVIKGCGINNCPF